MLDTLLEEIRRCQVCGPNLIDGANPIIQASAKAKILIIGQAPGLKVHRSSIPWDDASGDRLREWLSMDKSDFYDPNLVAIVPMGLCYPGKSKSGDLPPRKECAPLWHQRVLEQLSNVEMTLLIGQYAQKYYLPNKPTTLTETVQQWQRWAPIFIPLPHPSPRNNIWLKSNGWFEQSVLPYVRTHLATLGTDK
ncbi:uracil-DNA glycosylase family protein [Vibrio clamense]|uniref:uracil-DNA glycosylase family protein n=1 Tax=Vibrio clamense TaxID=2910254 RepID=UPI003D215620